MSSFDEIVASTANQARIRRAQSEAFENYRQNQHRQARSLIAAMTPAFHDLLLRCRNILVSNGVAPMAGLWWNRSSNNSVFTDRPGWMLREPGAWTHGAFLYADTVGLRMFTPANSSRNKPYVENGRWVVDTVNGSDFSAPIGVVHKEKYGYGRSIYGDPTRTYLTGSILLNEEGEFLLLDDMDHDYFPLEPILARGVGVLIA